MKAFEYTENFLAEFAINSNAVVRNRKLPFIKTGDDAYMDFRFKFRPVFYRIANQVLNNWAISRSLASKGGSVSCVMTACESSIDDSRFEIAERKAA